jgi:O-Antigen ligase
MTSFLRVGERNRTLFFDSASSMAWSRRSSRKPRPSWVEIVGMLVLTFTFSGYQIVAGLTPFTSVSNRSLSIVLRGAAFLAVLAILPRFSVYKSDYPFWICWGVFCCVYTARLIFDESISPNSIRFGLVEFLSWAVGATFVPSLASAFVNVKINGDRLFSLIYLSSFGALILNLYQVTWGSLRREDGGRAATAILNPISLGQLGLTVLLMSVWSLRRRRWRVISVLGFLAGGAGVYLSGSKGPIVSLCFAFSAYAIVNRRKLAKKAPLIGAAGLLFFGFLYTTNPENLYIVRRISSGGFGDASRVDLLKESFSLILRNPLMGGGFSTKVFYPHNVLVEGFLVCGMLSGLPLIACFYIAFSRLKSFASIGKYHFWIVFLFLQWFSSSLVSGAIEASSALFTTMTLIVSVSSTLEPGGRLIPKDQRRIESLMPSGYQK